MTLGGGKPAAPERVLAGLLLILICGTAVAVGRSWGAPYWWSGAAAALLLSGLALARSRMPLMLAVVVGQSAALLAVVSSALVELPAELSPAAAIALGVLTATGVRRLPLRFAAAVAAGSLLVAVACLLAGGVSGTGIPPVPAVNILAWVVAVAAGLVLRSLDERSVAVTATVRRQVQLDLARELHDVVAHHITGIIVQAQAGQLLTTTDPRTAEQTLRDIEQEGAASLTAIRRALGLLRDPRDTGLASCREEDLRLLAARVLGPHAPQLQLDCAPHQRPWPAQVELAAYRIVQEALTNAARHAAGATRIHVVVHETPGLVEVDVHDNGTAARPPRPGQGGYGLAGMAERAQALDGTVAAGPRPGGGWGVHARLPLDEGNTA